MKTRILDPNHTYFKEYDYSDSYNFEPTECFWVECEDLLEVYCLILPYMPDHRQAIYLYDRPNEHSGFYFWVSRDLTRIYQSFWVFPRSAMNHSKLRYIGFPPIKLESLKDLKNIENNYNE